MQRNYQLLTITSPPYKSSRKTVWVAIEMEPCKVNIFSLLYEPFEIFLCSLGQVLLPVVNYNLI